MRTYSLVYFTHITILIGVLILLPKQQVTAQLNFTVGSVTCSVGQDIEVPVSVNTISGATQISVNMPYATDLLYFSEVITTGGITNGSTAIVNASANGKTAINATFNRASAMSGNGVLFRLKGKCIGQGSSNQGLRFQSVTVNGTSTAMTLGTGSVTVFSGTNMRVWVDSKGRVSSNQYAIDIKMTKPDGWGVYSYRLELEFPSSAMRATGYESNGTLTTGMFVAFNNNTPGLVIISAAGTTEMQGNTQLLVRINVNQLASTSNLVPIAIRKFEIDNGSPKPDLTNAQWNPQITVPLESDRSLLPEKYSIGDAYPNPFNPSTVIPFELRSSGDVFLTVLDSIGRTVDVLIQGRVVAGRHEVQWNAGHLPSGMYMIRLNAGGEVHTSKVTLIK
jgi:hypothetical protein